MTIMTKEMLAGTLTDCPVMKISAKDTNKFVLLCDGQQTGFVSVVEIFDVGGKTPPNIHHGAVEYFYVMKGTGKAYVNGQSVDLKPGSFLFVQPGHTHEVHNTGDSRLYVLTTMVPDEKFSDLIKAGIPAELDEADLAALL
ncbi:cupin domain-containing protein [Thermobacillus sp. ZCTH02-B1]|uniref:cupin domain-containing protein n=1 Tax=Thermobacillus sp. ZCTH02-B1 TaxID=1858795 RepID=UPI0025E63D1E|nr:cupin domain-containing protein [Thermobacillus sp. ZCTH02-B1]